MLNHAYCGNGRHETKLGELIIVTEWRIKPFCDEQLRVSVHHKSCPDVILGIGRSERKICVLHGCSGTTTHTPCLVIENDFMKESPHYHGSEAERLVEEVRQEAIENALRNVKKNLAKLKTIEIDSLPQSA